MASVFREILIFFDTIGIYDVLLPFILVFTITFAILEKTKVFGTDEIEGKKYTKKNLNAMVAFVIGFLVVASSKLVAIITQVSSQVVILLLLAVFFLLLVGTFFKDSEDVFLEGGWRTLFMVIMFVGILIIFLQAIPNKHGQPWLEGFVNYIVRNFTSTAVASIVLLVVILIFFYFIVEPGKTSTAKPEKKE